MAKDRIIFIISFAFLGIAAAFLFSKKSAEPQKTIEEEVKTVKEVAKAPEMLPIEDGKVAVPFNLNARSAAVQFLMLGDIIDLIFTSKSDGSIETVSLTLLENIRVIGIGKDATGKFYNDPASFYKSNSPVEILLEMTPRQSEILSFAEINGSLTIGLKDTESDVKKNNVYEGLAEALLTSRSDENFNSILVTHMMRSIFPKADLKIISTLRGFIVKGRVDNPETSEKILEVLQMMSNKNSFPPINLLEVAVNPLQKKKMAPKDLSSFSIDPNKRAVLLELTSKYPVIPNLHQGSAVDLKFTSKSNIGFTPVSLTLMRGIKVIAVGRNIIGNEIDQDDPNFIPAMQVILEMNPREAEIFSYAKDSGILSLENAGMPQMNDCCDLLLEKLFESDNLERFQSVLITHTVNSLFPLVCIDVTSSPKGYIIKGKVPDPQMASKIIEIIVKLVPGGELAVINLLDVEPQLVLLKVLVYEVKRDFVSRVGVNWRVLFENINQSFAIGAVYPSPPFNDPNYFLKASGIFGNYNLSALIDMLQEDKFSKLIAEPNLTTVSGERANFFSGGEYPIPVPQGGLIPTVTIEYKKYGVSLDFTPHVDLNGLITLHVAPEVSDLDRNNSVVLQGFVIPGLLTRRVNTIVKLWPGQSYVIGGLILNTSHNENTNLYGLNRIPILGLLFQSDYSQDHQTELMVVVTPFLINKNRPETCQMPNPADYCMNENSECGYPTELTMSPETSCEFVETPWETPWETEDLGIIQELT